METNKDKKFNILYIAAFVVAFMVVCCLILVVASPTLLNDSPANPIIVDDTKQPSSPLFKTSYQVVYVVKGTATSVFITYNNAQGGTEQVDENLPWRKEMTISKSETSFLSIVAQSGSSGSITCEIWVDEKLLKTSTSTAQYGVVTCNDIVY